MPFVEDNTEDLLHSTDPNEENEEMMQVAPRFSPVSTAKSLQQYIKNSRSSCTVHKTTNFTKRFIEWMSEMPRKETHLPEQIPPIELDTNLGAWLLSLHMPNGPSC